MKRHNISPESYRDILPDIVQEAQEGAPESVRDFTKQLLTQVGNVLAAKVEDDLRNFDLSSKEDVDTYCRIVENYIEKAQHECLGRVVDVCPREDWESVWKKFSDGLLIVRQTVRDSLYTSLGVRLDLKTSLESGGFEAGKEKSVENNLDWVAYLEDEVGRLEAELVEMRAASFEKDAEIENIRYRLFDAESRISSLVRGRENVEKTSVLPEAVLDSQKTDQERAVDVLTGRIEQFTKQYQQVENDIGKWQEVEDDIIAFRGDIELYVDSLREKKADVELRLRIIPEENKLLLQKMLAESSQIQKQIKETDSFFVAIGKIMGDVQKEMHLLSQRHTSLRALLQTLHTARATLMSADSGENGSFSLGTSVDLVEDRLQDIYNGFYTIRDGDSVSGTDFQNVSKEKIDGFGITEGESFIAAKQVEDALVALRHTDISELENFFPVEYFGFDKEYAQKMREDFLDDIRKPEYPLRVKTLCALLLSAEDGGVKTGLPTDVLGAFTRRNDAKKVFSNIGIRSGSDIGGKLLMQLSILSKHTSDLRVVRREQGGFQRSEGGRATQTNFLTVYGRAAAEYWKQELLETGLVSQHFFEVFQSAVNDFKRRYNI